jgi:hypothetical protein
VSSKYNYPAGVGTADIDRHFGIPEVYTHCDYCGEALYEHEVKRIEYLSLCENCYLTLCKTDGLDPDTGEPYGD